MIALGGSAGINMYDSSTVPTGTVMLERISSVPLNFQPTGIYKPDGTFGVGGRYWLANEWRRYEYNFYFFNGTVQFNTYIEPKFGVAVRCVKSS